VVTQVLPGGGHVAVVVNGYDGVLVRDVTGAWTRIGDGRDAAAPVYQGMLPVQRWFDHITLELLWWALGTLAALYAGAMVVLFHEGATGRATLLSATLLTPCVLLACAAVDVNMSLAVAGVLAPGSLVVVPYLLTRTLRVLGLRAALQLTGLTVGIGLLAYLPYVVWGTGALLNYRVAVLASLAVRAAGLVAAAVFTRRALGVAAPAPALPTTLAAPGVSGTPPTPDATDAAKAADVLEAADIPAAPDGSAEPVRGPSPAGPAQPPLRPAAPDGSAKPTRGREDG
jgi:hypothetical protein